MSPDTPPGVFASLLLLLSLAVCAMSCAGLVAMKGFWAKLHYLAPPAVVGTAAVAGAILLQEGFGTCAIKAGLVLLVLVVGNPVLTYLAARTHRLREGQEAAKARPHPPPPP